jgi:nucleoside 2-deoxyribosyltransferase
MKVYYAHSVGIYGSKQEEIDIELLKSLGYKVVSPNTVKVQKGITSWKMKYGQAGCMEYFHNMLDQCDMIAFRADGKVGSGVWHEVQYMREQNKPVIELPTLSSTRALSIIEYLRLLGNR